MASILGAWYWYNSNFLLSLDHHCYVLFVQQLTPLFLAYLDIHTHIPWIGKKGTCKEVVLLLTA